MTEPGKRVPAGSVYLWELVDPAAAPVAVRAVVGLPNLVAEPGKPRGLVGRFARVRNATVINEPGPRGVPTACAIGDAQADDHGGFVFEPGRGGGRLDKIAVAEQAVRERYVQASRFGEVNTYFHLDRIGSHVDARLGEIGASALPRVTAVVNAHPATVDRAEGGRDGRRCPDGHHVPFQGGHYRLPGPSPRIPERADLSPHGEIHLGPGQKLTGRGALADLTGGPYRANASHNPGIIYHEYGHHICRHTADFRGNELRPSGQQSNKKCALEEGTADYFAAALLGTPHIWFFHHDHRPGAVHRRSLGSTRTMGEWLRGRGADAHSNGTIWAAALWDLRATLARSGRLDGATAVDRLVLAALLMVAEGTAAAAASRDHHPAAGLRALVAARRSFRRAAGALLEADRVLYRGALRDDIARSLAARGIDPQASMEPVAAAARTTAGAASGMR